MTNMMDLQNRKWFLEIKQDLVQLRSGLYGQMKSSKLFSNFEDDV